MKKYILIAGICIFLFSCKKDNKEINAVYLFSVNGFVSTFTNYSENAISYEWDFGDGTVHSSLKSPTHKFANPGTYVVTLISKDLQGISSTFKDNVIIYGATINIDGDFSDWADVSYLSDNVVNASENSSVTKVKVWGDKRAKTVSLYFEGDLKFGTMANIDMYINADGLSTTGWAIGYCSKTGSGVELQSNGSFAGSKTAQWWAVYPQTANQEWASPAWYDPAASSTVVLPKFSDLKQLENGNWAFEMKIDKSILKATLPAGANLGNNITFGIYFFDGGWNSIGEIPKKSNQSNYIKVDF